jgi:hypothetical protein
VIYQVLRRFQPEIQPPPAGEGGVHHDIERRAHAPDTRGESVWTQSGQSGQAGIERER